MGLLRKLERNRYRYRTQGSVHTGFGPTLRCKAVLWGAATPLIVEYLMSDGTRVEKNKGNKRMRLECEDGSQQDTHGKEQQQVVPGEGGCRLMPHVPRAYRRVQSCSLLLL